VGRPLPVLYRHTGFRFRSIKSSHERQSPGPRTRQLDDHDRAPCPILAQGDPALAGFSTVYFLKTAATLGIAEQLEAKAGFTPAGQGAVPVAKGESELGIGLTSEITPVAGVEMLLLKPDDPAGWLFLAGPVSAQAKDADAARSLLAYLQSGTARETFKSQGMTTP
jgi:molybdate transport system substrate-binding protein